MIPRVWPNGAAQESNLPSLGLPDLTGFEVLKETPGWLQNGLAKRRSFPFVPARSGSLGQSAAKIHGRRMHVAALWPQPGHVSAVDVEDEVISIRIHAPTKPASAYGPGHYPEAGPIFDFEVEYLPARHHLDR
jgi:hypothetical protein